MDTETSKQLQETSIMSTGNEVTIREHQLARMNFFANVVDSRLRTNFVTEAIVDDVQKLIAEWDKAFPLDAINK